MEGTFKKLASVTVVLTVGLLTATGVGPRTLTTTAQSLFNAKATQSATYALGEFFNRFAPNENTDSQVELATPSPVRLASVPASTVSISQQDDEDTDHQFPNFNMSKQLDVELAELCSTDAEPFITVAPENHVPAFQTVSHSIYTDSLENFDAQAFEFESRMIEVAQARTLIGPRIVPLSYRLITAASQSEFQDIPCKILRMVGVAPRAPMTRLPFAPDKRPPLLAVEGEPAS